MVIQILGGLPTLGVVSLKKVVTRREHLLRLFFFDCFHSKEVNGR